MNLLLELADRVEAAKEGSAALDREVQAAVGRQVWPSEACRPFGTCYTASLDAAMTLMPETAGYEIRRAAENVFGRAYVELWWVPKFPHKQHGKGATPALALTAASLRAIASMGSSGQ